MQMIRVVLNGGPMPELLAWAVTVVANLEALHYLSDRDSKDRATLDRILDRGRALVCAAGGSPHALGRARQSGVRAAQELGADGTPHWWLCAATGALALACSRGMAPDLATERSGLLAADVARAIREAPQALALPPRVAQLATAAVVGEMGDPVETLTVWLA